MDERMQFVARRLADGRALQGVTLDRNAQIDAFENGLEDFVRERAFPAL